MKRTFLSIMALCALSFFSIAPASAGWFDDADEKDTRAVLEQQAIYSKGQPVPKFQRSLERDIVRQIYQARNKRVATHTVWRGDTSVIEGDCKSIGFAIPYDTSLTNPVRPQQSSYGMTNVEQPEPNGLYASKNTTATWVMCVIGNETVPIPVEGRVTTYPVEVDVNYETNRVTFKAGAKPTVTIQQK